MMRSKRYGCYNFYTLTILQAANKHLAEEQKRYSRDNICCAYIVCTVKCVMLYVLCVRKFVQLIIFAELIV